MTDAPPPLPVMPLNYAEQPPAGVGRLVRAVGWVNVVVGTVTLFGTLLTLAFGFRGRGLALGATPVLLLGDLLVAVAQLASGIMCACGSRASRRITVVWLWTVSAVAALYLVVAVADFNWTDSYRVVLMVVVAASRYGRPIGTAAVSYLVVRRPASHGR